MSVVIYHNPRCSKSRQTLALLEAKGIEPEIIEWISQSDNLSDISTEVLPKFFGRILNWENNQIHIDIGRLEDLKAAQKFEIYDRKIPTQTPDAWEINFAKHEIHHLIEKNNGKVS